MFQRFALLWLFVSVECLTDEDSKPQNVTIQWRNDFEIEMSWKPPVLNCTKFKYNVSTVMGDHGLYSSISGTELCLYKVMNGGSLYLSVKADCGLNSSPVHRNFTYPELVSDLQCYTRSSTETECFWKQSNDVEDLRFFYRYPEEKKDCQSNITVQECQIHNTTDGKRAVWNQTNKREIHILFNGTVNNVSVRNTFIQEEKARPYPLKWEVMDNGDVFNISWNAPDIYTYPEDWNYQINYTECGTPTLLKISKGLTCEIPRVPHCPYCMTIRARWLNSEEFSEWSNKTCFDPVTDPNVWIYPVILIPLVFATLVVLTIMCCRKNKENIFPKVPEPRDLLSDISDNNNKITACNLYIPAKEEEDCKITLVIDPQLQKPDCR